MADEFDLEEVYDAEIAPLMSQIIEICKRREMPMIASFCFRHREDGDDFCTTLLPRSDWQSPVFSRAYQEIRSQPGFFAFTVHEGKSR